MGRLNPATDSLRIGTGVVHGVVDFNVKPIWIGMIFKVKKKTIGVTKTVAKDVGTRHAIHGPTGVDARR